MIERLEALLAKGQDNALVRFGLANAYLKAGDLPHAAEHLRAALRHDSRYSAAWKLLGKTLSENGQSAEAIAAYTEGIRVAEGRGDIQAAKEMKVFLRRLLKSQGSQGSPSSSG